MTPIEGYDDYYLDSKGRVFRNELNEVKLEIDHGITYFTLFKGSNGSKVRYFDIIKSTIKPESDIKKLTGEQIGLAHRMRSDGKTIREIADFFNTSGDVIVNNCEFGCKTLGLTNKVSIREKKRQVLNANISKTDKNHIRALISRVTSKQT